MKMIFVYSTFLVFCIAIRCVALYVLCAEAMHYTQICVYQIQSSDKLIFECWLTDVIDCISSSIVMDSVNDHQMIFSPRHWTFKLVNSTF